MKAKRALQRETIHAINHGNPQERKLPTEVKLSHAQNLSLNALQQDEMKLTKQFQEVQQALSRTIQARNNVLKEIGDTHKLSVEEISRTYQFSFDDQKLFIPQA